MPMVKIKIIFIINMSKDKKIKFMRKVMNHNQKTIPIIIIAQDKHSKTMPLNK